MTRGRMIKMKMSDDAEIGVYHVEPAGARRGGLVLIQEIFGVNQHIREISDEYAGDGYEVLAPALFDREAPGLDAGFTPEDLQHVIKIAREMHPFELSVADSITCIDALKPKGPVFMTGYCYGGSVVWLTACRSENLDAASSYYGSLVARFAQEQPKCPVILHFGEHDHGIPLTDVEKVKEAHPDVPVYIYDAGHAFNNSDRPDMYNSEAAKLARDRTLELFKVNEN